MSGKTETQPGEKDESKNDQLNVSFKEVIGKKDQKIIKKKNKDIENQAKYEKSLKDKQDELIKEGVVHFDYTNDSVELMIDVYEPTPKIIYQLHRLLKRHLTLINRHSITSPFYELRVSTMWKKTGYQTPDPAPRSQYFSEISQFENELANISKDCLISHKRLAHEFLRICYDDEYQDPYFEISVRFDKKAQVPNVNIGNKEIPIKEAQREFTLHNETLIIYRKIVAENVDSKIADALLRFAGLSNEIRELDKIRMKDHTINTPW
jgi:hypothetical protein